MTTPNPNHRPDRNHMVALAHALTLIKTEQFVKAEGIGLRVAEADPTNGDAWFIASVAAHEMGHNDHALQRVNQALILQPSIAEYHNHLGVVYMALQQPDRALVSFRRAQALNPDDPSTLANIARVLLQQGQAKQALPFIQQALELHPNEPNFMGDMAVILVACKEVEPALKLYEQALLLTPNNPEIHFNYSRALLLAGRYAEGWQENEWRWHSNHYKKVNKNLPLPCWDGLASLAGKRIVVLSEQGFGDAIQFVRFAQQLKQQNAYVIVQARPQLTRLFKQATGVDQALSLADPLPDADYCIPMFSLPKVLNINIQTIPTTPYLSVSPEWFTLPIATNPQRLQVGLIWSGNNQRTLHLHAFKPLFDLPGVEFHALQPGPKAAETQPYGIQDCSPHLYDFAATAAIMQQLELIITIDTAAAHLSGGMGRPFWLLTHATADWRWGLMGTTTPWYPLARLFRQQETGQWDEVIQNMIPELHHLIIKKLATNG